MNRYARNIFALIVTLLILTAVPAVALATNVSVSADPAAVKAGDAVTVTVIVTADHIGVASGSFTYDPALLTYTGSDGGASDGYINMVSAEKDGSSSLSAVIKFTAKAKGTAAVNVSIDSVLSYDEQTLEKGTGEVSISIAAADAPPQTSGVTSTPKADLSQTGVAAQNVTDAKTQMYVWRDLASLTLPSGYADEQVTYAGEKVGAADNGDMVLLYLSEASGGNGGYYIYNEQADTLVPYITITSKLASFTILWPDATVTAPDGFEKTTLEWNDQSLPAWKTAESDNIVYLVYARNAKGETGFYIFNAEDESVQRYAAVPEEGAAPSEQPASESTVKPVSGQTAANHTGVTIDRTLFIVLCVAAVLILAAAAVFASLYLRRTRGKLRRVTRMRERMEAEAKEKQAAVSSPAPQATEQKEPVVVQAPPAPTQEAEPKAPAAAQAPAPSAAKEKPASLVKDANLSDYPKGKDT